MWNKQQVTNWISEVCKAFEIEEGEVLDLKGQNGKALDSLPKDDWKGRSKHGDLFYNEWQKLKSRGSEQEQEKTPTVETGKQHGMLNQFLRVTDFINLTYCNYSMSLCMVLPSQTKNKSLFLKWKRLYLKQE